ncbi:ATP-binding protein [Vibrio renipiscarius]|uniref:ATPase AAA n=1 Tax=Vibrio renipiscarius TaxID=1461322 RepID=A0A0C2NHG5_9VIBR|nr:ATP-binding protein [Vibrio renipiscarius]KII75800.1 ATPase AAA [Vibrio renipiscarius]KII81750.1 ATPase AAA [Vibrio renipiscarius]
MPKLTLIRGLPGSGKSTLASTYHAAHFEADMYFALATGQYQFDPLQLEQAHKWCQEQTEHALRKGQDVVVSNTFVRRWEIKPYFEMAKKLKATFEVIECTGGFQNIHGVSPAVIDKMRSRWQSWK